MAKYFHKWDPNEWVQNYLRQQNSSNVDTVLIDVLIYWIVFSFLTSILDLLLKKCFQKKSSTFRISSENMKRIIGLNWVLNGIHMSAMGPNGFKWV